MNHSKLSGYLCECCVVDVVLKERLKDGVTIPKCFWCRSKQVRALPVGEFGSDFRELVEWAYEAELIGKRIDYLLFDDWRIFSRKLKNQTGEVRREFALALLTGGVRRKELCLYPDYDGMFVRKPNRLVENWYRELEGFLSGEGHDEAPPAAQPDEPFNGRDHAPTEVALPSEFEVVLEDLSRSLPKGAVFWRARRYKRPDKDVFALKDVTAPPPEHATAGRANRKGEPVLYLASDASTAIAEVRGWKAWPIALAEFRLEVAVRIVDTTEAEKLRPVSPFEEGFRWKADLMGLLLQLRAELSRPVSPDEELALYRPTQRFCELVRSYGYGGVMYPSAMGKGFNLVLFDWRVAVPENLRHVRVTGVNYRVRPLANWEPLFDEQPYDYLLGKNAKS